MVWLQVLGPFVVGLAVAYFLYWKSSEQLREEAATLKRYTAMLLRVMQNQGWVTLSKNEEGELVIALGLKASIHAASSVSQPDLKIIEKTEDE